MAGSKLISGSIGIIVSVALIAGLFFFVDFSEVAGELASMNFIVFIPCVLIVAFHYILRSVRWRYLLPEETENQVTLKLLFDSMMVGNLANFILPLRAGEFIRPAMLCKKSNFSFSSSFASVVIERFFDLSMVLFSFGIMFLFIEGLPVWVFTGAMSLSVLALLLLAFIITGILFPAPVLAITEKVIDIFFRVLHSIVARFSSADFTCRTDKLAQSIKLFVEDFIGGASLLRRDGRWVKVILLTVIVWLSCYLLYYVFFFLFDINPTIELAVCVTVLIALAVAAPSAPGFIGVYQAGCIAGFVLFGESRDAAVAYSIATHIFQYIVIVLYGTYALMSNGVSLKGLQKREKVT